MGTEMIMVIRGAFCLDPQLALLKSAEAVAVTPELLFSDENKHVHFHG